VRHEDRSLDAATALRVRDALGDLAPTYARIEQVEVRTATIALGGGLAPGMAEVSYGWHLKSPDGAWTIALLPDHFSLETTRYPTWAEYRETLAKLVRAIATEASPSLEQRVGLRYVDQVQMDNIDAPADWAQWIEPYVLGPILHSELGAAVLATRQQVDLELDGGSRCVLRHGTARQELGGPAEPPTYVLDFDVYRQSATRFDADEVLAAADHFHTHADALFQHVVTDSLLRYLAEDDNG
jgi:uncharacterized protein (TIGR04255 family)